MTTLDEIELVFNALHDAYIVEGVRTEGELRLRLSCEYLAELIHPGTKEFEIVLQGVSTLNFTPWWRNSTQKKAETPSLEVLFARELEILSATQQEKCVELSCEESDPHAEIAGGVFQIAATGLQLYDPSGALLEPAALQSVAKQYWDGFGGG